jgi:hypothetical protein
MMKFDQQPTMIAHFQDIKYQPLLAEKENKTEIDDTCPIYEFSTGKSYVRGFLLPAERPLEVSIHSYFIGLSVHETYLFIPCALLLDQHRQVNATIDPEDRKIERTYFGESNGPGYMNKLTFTITAQDSVESFVLYTTQRHCNETSEIKIFESSPIIMPNYVGAIPLGMKTVTIPHSPVGKMKIIAKKVNP